MNNRETDPLESQVRILFGKAAGQCSYPECGAKLVVPSRVKGDQPKNVAKIAHITAASPEGPRYDHTLSKEDRRSEPNLILVCGPHHDAIDGQLSLHTVEWLFEAKGAHEARIDRGYRYSIGAIGYKQLEAICTALTLEGGDPDGDSVIGEIDESMDIGDKIEYNCLGQATRELIELGMAQDREVRRFITTFDQMSPNFAIRLTAWFKKIYYTGVSEGLDPDAQFDAILGSAYEHCGVRLTNDVAAAALAVVAHLFSICEIFEHEPAVA